MVLSVTRGWVTGNLQGIFGPKIKLQALKCDEENYTVQDFIICSPRKHHQGGKIRKCDIDGIFVVLAGGEECVKIYGLKK